MYALIQVYKYIKKQIFITKPKLYAIKKLIWFCNYLQEWKYSVSACTTIIDKIKTKHEQYYFSTIISSSFNFIQYNKYIIFNILNWFLKYLYYMKYGNSFHNVLYNYSFAPWTCLVEEVSPLSFRWNNKKNFH